MKLKSLELFGFKSFVDKTTFNFEGGVTAIVGPNGVGKSNCVDAIRWVMGEQSAKHLRGQEMQDVIFNGTASKAALGMSQVTLTFDTADGRAPAGYTDYSEIAVERRLYRSGESDYSINKIPCRLRDIIDLFLGTGVGTKAYSIIEQGRVERIVSSKPEERRFFIEEAAGISKFKNRKEAALRKMESTEANLARLNDIVSEIKRQLAGLDRQARKAERYRKLFEELKGRDLKLSSLKYGELRSQLDSGETQKTLLQEEETTLGAKLSEVELTNEKERLKLTETEQELSSLQEQFYIQQNAAKLHEATLSHQASKLKDLDRLIETATQEIEGSRIRLRQATEELSRLNENRVTLDLALATERESAEGAQEALEEGTRVCGEWKNKTEEAGRALLGMVAQIAEYQSRSEYLDRREVETNGRLAKGQAEIDAIDLLLEELERKIKKADQGLEDLKQLSLKLSKEGLELQESLIQKQKYFEEIAKLLETSKGALAFKESKLESLESIRKNLEGYEEGVRAVLKASNTDLSGICGPISDCIDTDNEYEAAVNAVLGDKLQYVVVRSQEEGVEALQYLRQQAKGRSTFVPLNVRSSPPLLSQSSEGVLGSLLEKIRFKDDFRAVAQYLFGDCLLVEDLQKALHLSRNAERDKTWVTLEGDLIDRSGVISGGTNNQETLLGLQRRIEGLSLEVALGKTQVAETQTECEGLKKEVASLKDRLDTFSRDSHGDEIRRITQEQEGQRLGEERDRYHQERDRLTLEVARSLDEKRENAEEKQRTLQSLENLLAQRGEVERELASSQVELAKALSDKEHLAKAMASRQVLLSQALERVEGCERQLEQWVQTKIDLTQTIEKRIGQINEARSGIAQVEKGQNEERLALEEALKKKETLSLKQQQLKMEYEKLSAALREKSLSLRELRHQHEERVKKFHASELQLAEIKNELRSIQEQIFERYKIDLENQSREQPVENILDKEEEAKVITGLKEKLENLGSVHVGAIEEYEELKERFDFLSQQQQDLTESLEALKRAIQKINRVSRERFLSAFEQVNQKFQEIFPRLFKGGKARLLLIDQENLLETGVEIFAQPPGKKFQSISLLSGGEKALTAVALIFSIFLIKPSPFCLLDEVDAPLDDANIDRFNELVREMTSQSQFIVITHNKRTMEQADSLYGITMQEAGVSKVVSVRLNESSKESLPQVA